MEALLRDFGKLFRPVNMEDKDVKRGVVIIVIITEFMAITAEVFVWLGGYGKNIFWFLMACVLIVDIVTINWIIKKDDINKLKTVAKIGLVLALIMLPVCTVWKTASVESAAEYIGELMEAGVTHTVSVGPEKMKLAHVKNGYNLWNKSDKPFSLYEGKRGKEEEKTAQPNGGVITFFDLPEEGVDLYVNAKESCLLAYRISKI